MNIKEDIQRSITHWIEKEEKNSISRLSALSGLSRATIRNLQLGRNNPQIRTAYRLLAVTVGRDRACHLIKTL